ncbi:MAG: HNH endonuclease [Polyangia bacterium]
MRAPAYVLRFRDLLVENTLPALDLEFGKTRIAGHRGILTTSRLQYNHEDWQLLHRELEYTFTIGREQQLEISLQLYLNVNDHWRLFAYCARGMLFSVNLTLLRHKGAIFTLTQTLRLATRKIGAAARATRADELCGMLRRLGMEVDENHRLVLGTFDGKSGVLVDTTPQSFLRSFLTVALVKGHFMGNKGYSLQSLPKREVHPEDAGRVFKGRSVPLGLRYEILEAHRFRCCACGHGAKEGVKLHVDHIIPVARGGRTEKKNLQILCTSCNLGKGDRSERAVSRS